MKLLILAGGSGTRLWPLSRARHPKQVRPLYLPASLGPPTGGDSPSAGRAGGNSATLLQQTWRRLRQNYQPADIYVSTNHSNCQPVKAQLPELKPANLIIEPASRNTAPAILLAAKILAPQLGGEALATVNSDHYIASAKKYLQILSAGEQVLSQRRRAIGLIGIKPTYPETGYGYIKLGKKLRGGIKLNAYQAVRFTEKPSLARARQYVRRGKYLWNSGLFIFHPAELLQQLNKLAPALARALNHLQPYQNKHRHWTVSSSTFRRLAAISFDYAVVERAADLVVVAGDFGWADVGHWRTVYDILAKPAGANISQGDYWEVNSRGNLVYSLSRRLVATVGLKDTIIIDTPDALLVCPKSQAQAVKLLVEKLKKQKKHKYL